MACTCSLRNKQYKPNGRFLREAAFYMEIYRNDLSKSIVSAIAMRLSQIGTKIQFKGVEPIDFSNK